MDNTVFLAQQTAAVLIQSNIIDFCLKYLQSLLTYWKAVSTDDNSPPIGGVLLKEHLTAPPPDMNPFFLKQYVKGKYFLFVQNLKKYVNIFNSVDYILTQYFNF